MTVDDKFFNMAKESEETAGTFTARLKGQAASCGFVINWPSANCSQLVEYLKIWYATS